MCQRCQELNTSYVMAFSQQIHEECCKPQSKCVHLQPTDAISINSVLLQLFETSRSGFCLLSPPQITCQYYHPTLNNDNKNKEEKEEKVETKVLN